MKGKNLTHKFFVLPVILVLFFCTTIIGVWADDEFKNQVYLLFNIQENRLGSQEANVLGAFNTNGWIHTSEGLTGVNAETDEVVPVLSTTPAGGMCVGDCGQDFAWVPRASSTGLFDEVVPETISETSLLGGSQEETSELDRLDETDEPVAETVDSENESTGSLEETTEKTVEVETETVEPESRGSSSRSSPATPANDEAEEETASSTDIENAATSSTSTIVEVTERETEEGDESSPINQFFAKFISLVDISGGSIGIGMNALEQFTLSVHGWMFTTQGVLIGDPQDPTGLGLTSEGICLGACDFDIPRLIDDGASSTVVENNQSGAAQLPAATSSPVETTKDNTTSTSTEQNAVDPAGLDVINESSSSTVSVTETSKASTTSTTTTSTSTPESDLPVQAPTTSTSTEDMSQGQELVLSSTSTATNQASSTAQTIDDEAKTESVSSSSPINPEHYDEDE